MNDFHLQTKHHAHTNENFPLVFIEMFFFNFVLQHNRTDFTGQKENQR